MKKFYKLAIFLFVTVFFMSGCGKDKSTGPTSEISVLSEISAESEVSAESEENRDSSVQESEIPEELIEGTIPAESEDTEASEEEASDSETQTTVDVTAESNVLYWNDGWTYASFSAIHSDSVTLYCSQNENRKDITVAINAGHGTSGGSSVKTQCHPDGSAKVTGGSTTAGATTATAVSGGTTFLDGTSEASGTLSLAILAKEKLLQAGYDVLMIRETDDCQLDNIARTGLWPVWIFILDIK